MKEYNVTLTEKDMELISTCLCSEILDCQKRIEIFEKAVNMNVDKSLSKKNLDRNKDKINECDKLWHKLQDILYIQ